MRITDMKTLSDILCRIRENIGTNQIHNELGSHKTVIARLRETAIKNNWHTSTSPIPGEEELQLAYKANFKTPTKEHKLDPYKEKIKEWKEAKESFVVICRKLSVENPDFEIPESTLRDYYNRYIKKSKKTTNRRDNDEPTGIAELDFGYLGLTFDLEELRNRKTWFISIRFRYGRHAIRRKLYNCNTFNVLSAMISIFNELGAVPVRLVIDNFKAAIKKACRYDPTETEAFRVFAMHYGFLIDPCIPGKAEHKGGVETDVKYVKKNFWPVFKHEEHLKGHEKPHGNAIDKALKKWNIEVASKRPIREAGNKSPEILFEEEYQNLKPLPEVHFEPYNEEVLTAKDDYHVRYDSNWYSIPSKKTGETFLLKAYPHRIKLFQEGKLIALHVRSYEKGKRITEPSHHPENMKEYLKRTVPWLLIAAQRIGLNTYKVADKLAQDKVMFRKSSIQGLIGLAKKYGNTRVENACIRALHFNLIKYGSIKTILLKGKDKEPIDPGSENNGQLLFFKYARSGHEYNYPQEEKNYEYNTTITTSTSQTKNVRDTGNPG